MIVPDGPSRYGIVLIGLEGNKDKMSTNTLYSSNINGRTQAFITIFDKRTEQYSTTSLRYNPKRGFYFKKNPKWNRGWQGSMTKEEHVDRGNKQTFYLDMFPNWEQFIAEGEKNGSNS